MNCSVLFSGWGLSNGQLLINNIKQKKAQIVINSHISNLEFFSRYFTHEMLYFTWAVTNETLCYSCEAMVHVINHVE